MEEDPTGSPENVHFQPPPGEMLAYPAIIYTRGRQVTEFADNKPYRRAQNYLVSVIHHDPDNGIRDKIAAMPYCTFDRSYATDGLHHDVYNLFY